MTDWIDTIPGWIWLLVAVGSLFGGFILSALGRLNDALDRIEEHLDEIKDVITEATKDGRDRRQEAKYNAWG